MYNIKEFSKMTGIPASSLRYYEELGFLKNVQRDANGVRQYTDCDLARIGSVICFKESGLPLSKIQDFFRYEENLESEIDQIIDLVDTQEQAICDKIDILTKQLEHIRHKSRYYHGIKHAIDNHEVWPSYDSV